MDKLYNTDLAIKGVSAIIGTINTTLLESSIKPTDEMLSSALYLIELQLDQIAADIARHDEEELARLRAISKHTDIPMMQLYELV